MPSITTLVSFNSTNGAFPEGSLIADLNGDLFGTTTGGGTSTQGTVFEIANTASGYASSPTTLVSFNGTNGATPLGSLIADANGNLFGTTTAGGASGDGTVFEIAKTASGYASSPTTLVSFNGTNGTDPEGSLIADAGGDLFGTTASGGANGNGTVFEIANTASGYASSPTTLVSFNEFAASNNGASPRGSLIADTNGNLFGTTSMGGASGNGTVFEVANTASGYAGMPTTLVSFNGSNGDQPFGSLIADATGDLFGTTTGGGASDNGTVFEIANTASGYASSPTTLVSFNSTNGAFPQDSLIADANGDLLGTTAGGGASGDGTLFEIAKTASGYASSPTTLVSFNGTNGSSPVGSLIADATGDLFGTTESDGASGDGTVFEVSPLCFLAGTRILTPAGDDDVEALSVGSLVTTSDGCAAPVRWIGRQTVCRTFADPLRLLPIRIKAGALADNVPSRDLLLSPCHAVLVNNVLVQAGALVNGTSIVRETNAPERFVYYHIELDDHALILTEGVSSETFVDNVNRMAFDNWDEHLALYPEGHAIKELPFPRAQSHRQVSMAIRRMLSARADTMTNRATLAA